MNEYEYEGVDEPYSDDDKDYVSLDDDDTNDSLSDSDCEEFNSLLELSSKAFKNKSVKVIILPQDKKKITDTIQLHDITKMLSARGVQISKSGKHFVNNNSVCTNAKQYAWEELYSRRFPLLLRKFVYFMPNGDIVMEEVDPNTSPLVQVVRPD